MLELIFSILIMIVSYAVLLTTMRHAWKPIKFSLVLVSITSAINCLSNIRLCALDHSFLQTYDEFAHLAFFISIFLLLATILVRCHTTGKVVDDSFIKDPLKN